MPLTYADKAIPDSAVPRAASPIFQHMLDIYVSETNKVASVWREFSEDDLPFRPHPRSATVQDIFRHQLLWTCPPRRPPTVNGGRQATQTPPDL